MDSISQIVLGAAVAEASLGKKVGNKAALWGAIAGTVPDLDVIGVFFLDTVNELIFHRGFTHSIVFSLFFAPILGWLIFKIYPKENASQKDWTLMSFLSLITHPILDCFTTWGTQLFWPFDYRVAWSSVFVIDPLYTLPFAILLVTSLCFKRESLWRFRLNVTGLVVSTTFLGVTLLNKGLMKSAFEKEAERQNIPVLDIEVRPAPLQNILWTANMETEKGYFIGYRSFLDQIDDIEFHYFPKNEILLQPYKSNEELQRLLSMTKGWYTVTQQDSSHFAINDLRLGLVDGLGRSNDDFVFSYTMTVGEGEELTFEQVKYKFGKDVRREMISQLWTRIRGHK